MNAAAVQALARGLGLTEQRVEYHDLDEFIGTWVQDDAFDKAVADMDRVDPEMWK